MKKSLLLLIPLTAVSLTLTGKLIVPADAHGPGRGMQRHHYFMMNGIPPEYRGKRNPLPADAETIAAGIKVFQENCALCHGADGRGQGEGAEDLDPPPANLMAVIRMPMTTDAFLFWTISEGGEFLGTDMPSYHEALSEEQTWQVIRALRAGLKPPKKGA